jgi:hypothetical protein
LSPYALSASTSPAGSPSTTARSISSIPNSGLVLNVTSTGMGASARPDGPSVQLSGRYSLDGTAIDPAVLAQIRHSETDYDRLLARGMDRHEAHGRVASFVDVVVRRWLG